MDWRSIELSEERARNWLVVIAVVLIVTTFAHGIVIDLWRHATGRVQYHAAPVAISFLYHGHPYDYTAYKSVALPFQSPTPFDDKIKASVRGEIPPNDGTYFWLADDKGMGDYAVASFLLFGPSAKALYLFYFVLLSATAAAFIVGFWKNRAALGILGLALVGVHVAISILPLVDEGSFLGVAKRIVPTHPVSVYEPRYFDVLSMIAVLHLCLAALLPRKLSTWATGALVFQVFFLLFLLHARSSLGWQVVAIGAVFVAATFTDLRGPNSKDKLWIDKRRLIPVIVLACGLVGLHAYKHAMYHPKYFEEAGSRTTWHNALMGLAVDKTLREKYGIAFGDREIVDAVIAHVETAKGMQLNKEYWNSTNILNSLGGHSSFDWKTYETYSRSLFLHIFAEHPVRSFVVYTVIKPLYALQTVIRAWLPARDPDVREYRSTNAIGFSPFALIHLVFVVPILILCWAQLTAVKPQLLLALGILFLASLIPAVAFYSAILTVGGTFVLISMALYLFAAGLLLSLVRRFTRRFGWTFPPCGPNAQ